VRLTRSYRFPILGASALEKCGTRKGNSLPKDAGTEQNAKMKELSALSGQDFDRKFIEHNVKDHENDIKVFQHYAREESDPGVKALAERGVKMLKEHLKMAQQIQQKL
jgi:putative membrane protein